MAPPRRSSRRNRSEEDDPPPQQEAGQRSVAASVRDRQRLVAEREASRLALPESKPKNKLGHADRKKSAVSSTPAGYLAKQNKGGDGVLQEEWCGPFSVARQFIAEREEASRKQEAELEETAFSHPLDQAMEELDQERKRKAHPSLQWKSRLDSNASDSIYAKRQKRTAVLNQGKRVPSLFDTCVNFLVANFEYVESLGVSLGVVVVHLSLSLSLFF
jgi:hypothetical protein